MIISESNLLHYIQSNFTDSLTLNDLAATFYISKNRVSEMIQNATGRSFSQYLIDIRLEEAVNLLRNTELPIAEVALQSGFSSNSVFSQTFHKRYQMSPSYFRQHLEIKKLAIWMKLSKLLVLQILNIIANIQSASWLAVSVS
ncbi:hypothetical protein LX03_07825 [Limosilactobacillus mucosae]|uniref:HTH araC/xylS-type domain-containing protein n=1 Tax=Limosilactobacillus mucosae TaxID=97478 RepID=A0A099YCE9_LIMMU|nr:hypothetical protein LX03_07825 [Limosilactobacillus mucosae]